MATETKTVRYGLSVDNTTLPTTWFDKCWLYDNSGVSYLDETTDANTQTGSDVPLTGYTDVDDCVYFGDAAIFGGMMVQMTSAASGGVRVLEYWNGGSWATLPNPSGTPDFTSNGYYFWTPPSDWATTSVNGSTQYYVRLRVTSTVTTPGTLAYVSAFRCSHWQKTIYIPEATNRTFDLALLKATCMQLSPYVFGLGMRTSNGTAVACETAPVSGTTAVYSRTSYLLSTTAFSTCFGTGTSATFDFYLIWGQYKQGDSEPTVSWSNTSAELIITYTADTQSTRIKSVCIPIESLTANTDTSLAEIGTNQWPDLSTFCPEASKTFRDVYLNFFFGVQNTTTGYWSVALDSEAAVDLIPDKTSGNGYVDFVWVRNDASTSSSHAVKVKHTVASTYGRGVGGLLWVTYEYDASSTTSVLNSVMICAHSEALSGYAATNYPMKTQVDFLVPEPETVTLVQSGVVVKGIFNISVTSINFSCGSQSNRAYLPTNTASAIASTFVHRIDSGGASGSGISLTRGRNTLKSTVQTDSGGPPDCYLVAILNYTSGVASGGISKHNKTITWPVSTQNSQFSMVSSKTVTLSLGSSYYLNSLHVYTSHPYYIAPQAWGILRTSGEGDGDGIHWLITTASGDSTSAAYGYGIATVSSLLTLVKRYPTDPTWGAVAVTSSHSYIRKNGYGLNYLFDHLHCTYCSATFSMSGTVSGYTGDGSGLTVDIFRASDDKLLGSATTTTGGAYTFTWYTDNENLYAVCRQSDTLCGRSTDGKAS